MSIAQTLLPEFDQEMASTRKVLEGVPDDKLGWKSHPKSNTIGWNAAHLAEIPGWTDFTLTQESLDIHPPGQEPYRTQPANSRQEVLERFDKNVVAGRKAIESTSDVDFMKNWSLLSGGQTVLTMPRAAVIRTFVMNHMIHHRAILCAYLRLNDIPVPGLYGPSGDE